MTDHMTFEDEDFVIRVRPTVSDEDWTGEIDISIISGPDTPMDD